MIIKSNGFWIKHQSNNHEQRPLQRRPNPTGALRALDIVLHPTCIASRACFDLAFWDLQCCKYGVPLKKKCKDNTYETLLNKYTNPTYSPANRSFDDLWLWNPTNTKGKVPFSCEKTLYEWGEWCWYVKYLRPVAPPIILGDLKVSIETQWMNPHQLSQRKLVAELPIGHVARPKCLSTTW